jgi:hypothetical protein
MLSSFLSCSRADAGPVDGDDPQVLVLAHAPSGELEIGVEDLRVARGELVRPRVGLERPQEEALGEQGVQGDPEQFPVGIG